MSAQLEFKSPSEEDCAQIGFKPPDSTVLHMLSRQKPTDQASAAEWNAYVGVLDFAFVALPSCWWVDAKNYKGKTALHLAAAGNNKWAMKLLFDMGAGHYQELRVIFHSPIGPFIICRWISICCRV